jgi:hypothetical protein
MLKYLCCPGRCNQKVQSPFHVHYVAPSFWAWKGGESRLSKLRNFVDHILCILPFEEEICRLNGLPATYVGHPLLDDAIGLNMVGHVWLCFSIMSIILEFDGFMYNFCSSCPQAIILISSLSFSLSMCHDKTASTETYSVKTHHCYLINWRCSYDKIQLLE